jgi:uncharacterized protein (DUF58 family)
MLPPDRGARQRLKILQLLAAVEADGTTPIQEALATGMGRLRRGMTAIVLTPTLDPAFVRPVAALKGRGIATVIVSLDTPAFDPAPDADGRELDAQHTRALRHTLAEYQLRTHVIGPRQALAEVLAR